MSEPKTREEKILDLTQRAVDEMSVKDLISFAFEAIYEQYEKTSDADLDEELNERS